MALFGGGQVVYHHFGGANNLLPPSVTALEYRENRVVGLGLVVTLGKRFLPVRVERLAHDFLALDAVLTEQLLQLFQCHLHALLPEDQRVDARAGRRPEAAGHRVAPRGAFVNGNAIEQDGYHGENFARRGDAVFCSLNHRLGPMGFSNFAGVAGQQFAKSGNVGMLDIVAALEWVRDNIANFGATRET